MVDRSADTALRSADKALQSLDRLLAKRPERVGHDFSEATRWIAMYRDELIASWRRTASETDWLRLEKVNAVLSVVVGGTYPLTRIPWASIEHARHQLALVTGETD